MHNNFTIRDFYQNLGQIFPQAIFLPDAWNLDVYVYEGRQVHDLPEYQPQILLDDSSLPKNYKKVLDSFDFIQPSEVISKVLTLSPHSGKYNIEFELDLTRYRSATLVLLDYITFQGEVCNSPSMLTDCVTPAKIVIDSAGGRFQFRWNPQQRHQDFFRGFWNWQKL